MTYLNLHVSDLLVWTENPRLNLYDSSKHSEKEIINLLIEIVGSSKMYTIIEDIFFHGLAGNHLVLTVKSGETYLVYDGNRRISSIKILCDPTIIDNIQFREKIIALKKSSPTNSETIDKVSIYCAVADDISEAHRLMDLEHMGEQEGKGTISWESYIQDDVRVKRGFDPILPISHSVYRMLKLTPSDFKTFPYTDLNRLFGSKLFKEAFSIKDYTDYSDENIALIKEGYRALLEYKKVKNFRSFTRKFDVITESSDGRNPMMDFIKWYNDNSKYDYYISCNENFFLFIGDKFDINQLKITITDKKRKSIGDVQKNLSVKYISPDGTELKSLNTSLAGTWKVVLDYKKRLFETKVEVKQLLNPTIEFTTTKYELERGKSLDLLTIVRRAVGRRNRAIDNTKLDVAILNSTATNTYLNGTILEGSNEIGNYTIRVSFEDEGLPVSDVFTVSIVENHQLMKANTGSHAFLVTDFAGVNSVINFNLTVAELITEINSLDYEKYEAVIFCSIRILVEFSLDTILSKGYIQYSTSASLETRLTEFAKFITTGGVKRILAVVSNAFTNKADIHNWWNNSENIKNLSALLNDITHRSNWAVPANDFKKYCRVGVSQLIYIADFLYKHSI